MGICLDDESRIQQIFCQASSRSQAPALTDEVLAEISAIPYCQGDTRLQLMLIKDACRVQFSPESAAGELGKMLAQLDLDNFSNDERECDFKSVKEFIAQQVIGAILFKDKPLTPVKAGILATVTTPGDPRIREIVNNALPEGGFNWAIVQELRI